MQDIVQSLSAHQCDANRYAHPSLIAPLLRTLVDIRQCKVSLASMEALSRALAGHALAKHAPAAVLEGLQ